MKQLDKSINMETIGQKARTTISQFNGRAFHSNETLLLLLDRKRNMNFRPLNNTEQELYSETIACVKEINHEV